MAQYDGYQPLLLDVVDTIDLNLAVADVADVADVGGVVQSLLRCAPFLSMHFYPTIRRVVKNFDQNLIHLFLCLQRRLIVVLHFAWNVNLVARKVELEEFDLIVVVDRPCRLKMMPLHHQHFLHDFFQTLFFFHGQ